MSLLGVTTVLIVYNILRFHVWIQLAISQFIHLKDSKKYAQSVDVDTVMYNDRHSSFTYFGTY